MGSETYLGEAGFLTAGRSGPCEELVAVASSFGYIGLATGGGQCKREEGGVFEVGVVDLRV